MHLRWMASEPLRFVRCAITIAVSCSLVDDFLELKEPNVAQLFCWTTLFSLMLTVAMTITSGGSAQGAEPRERMLSHDVFFTLKDNSEKAKQDLVAGCKKYLTGHPGSVWFAAGARVEEHRREVNDAAFDVALHIVFADKASHDAYQNAERHHQFIEQFKDNWKTVRVFDSWLDATQHETEDEK